MQSVVYKGASINSHQGAERMEYLPKKTSSGTGIKCSRLMKTCGIENWVEAATISIENFYANVNTL